MNSIPNEILLHILSFLPGRENHLLKRVSKRFGVIFAENKKHMRKMRASMTISDGFEKGFMVENMPFELVLDIGGKEVKIYADHYGEFTGNASFCRKFAHSLKRVTSTWSNRHYRRRRGRPFMFGFNSPFQRNFDYEVNQRIVHSRDFPLVVLFQRMAAYMDFHELTVKSYMCPLMQHVLGEVAKTTKFRLDTFFIPARHIINNASECNRFEIFSVLDWEKNRNSKILLYDPKIRHLDPRLTFSPREIVAMNALGKKYENVFWITDLQNMYDAISEILTSWVNDDLNEINFGFMIIQGEKLNMWNTQQEDFEIEMNRLIQQRNHVRFVQAAILIGITSNYYDSDYDEWTDIANLPSNPLEFYFGAGRTVRVTFEKKDEDTAIARVSIL